MTSVLTRIPTLSDFSAQLLRNCGGVRYASKKTSSGARWQGNCKRRPRHRGVKFDDGTTVTAGSTIVKQIHLFTFPGLNVGFSRRGNLFAMEAGKVLMTCEKPNVNWDHTWVKRTMSDQNPAAPFYKVYYHVIPEPQHNRFKLVETV